MKLFTVTLMTAVLSSAFAASAKADGFICETTSQDLLVKIFNHTNPEVGTRVGAVMVLSDPAVSFGRKTIARFQEVNGVLTNRASKYEANVDLRFNDSNRKGELILGTKLGELDTVVADIDFSYGSPVPADEDLPGILTLTKRNGQKIQADLICARYLKGE